MLTSFVISSFLLALSPGPDNLYVAALTSDSGKKSGFWFLTGLLIGCLIHTILLAFGLNAIILEYENAFNLIKYFGIIYLIYLSFQIYFSENNFSGKKIKLKKSSGVLSNLRKGLMMNLLNPKVFIFFAIFFPNFIFSETVPFKIQIIILGLIFMIITLLIFGVIILISDIIYEKFSHNSRVRNYIKYFNIIVLLFIALLIFFTENSITLY